MPLPIFALAIASFCIGTTEFVIMGLLPEMAADLGVSIPAAGLLVTGYALGVVFGAPILAIATSRMPRKSVLVGLTTLFVIGNFLCAIAPNYSMLMAARIVTAFGHGAFFGIGSVVAASLVERHLQARAMAMLFAGLTLANILGVPAGTALGAVYGWRSTFYAVVVIGIVATSAIAWFVPKGVAPPSGAGVLGEIKVLGKLQVWLAMLISMLVSASLFSVFTYIKPLLTEVTLVSTNSVTWILLLFGGGMTVGNIIGGRLADWKLIPTIIISVTLMAVIQIIFFQVSAYPTATVLLIFVWGIVLFMSVPPLQMRVVSTASGAPNLASTLNQSAFNVGNAAGAWVGGAALSQGIAYSGLPLVAAGLAIAALTVALWSLVLERTQPAVCVVEA